MSFFSVVIPCYNSKEYIGQLFDSFEHQTFKDFDVIFVDDCSSDGTPDEIERKAKDSVLRVKLLRSEKNEGPSASRRKGILVSDSNYISFCDSDDLYDNRYLKEMYDCIIKEDCDIVFCNHVKLFSSERKKKINNVEGIKGLSKRELIAMATDSLCCLSVRRSIISTIDFPSIRNGEDMAIIPVLINKSAVFGFVEKYLYYYYCKTNTLSNSFSSSVFINLQQSFEYIVLNLEQEYSEEIEFLGIRNYLYGSLLIAFKNKCKKRQITELITWFERKYKSWISNKYFSKLPFYKRVFLLCAKKNLYVICRFMGLLHNYLMNGK